MIEPDTIDRSNSVMLGLMAIAKSLKTLPKASNRRKEVKLSPK
jgi:hypothetical protein